MKKLSTFRFADGLFQLLRWNKPAGRLILLIPACWSLWLTPSSPPELSLIFLIVLGGLAVSGAGCIANDLWDREIDGKVQRTRLRPLPQGVVSIKTAVYLLISMLLISLFVVLSLPVAARGLCFGLSFLAFIVIMFYPSAKRWFAYPQAILAFCWGFAVLIPWASSQWNLGGGWPLWGCWLATLFWTFGFDTVYAMADQEDDQALGLNSSVISLGEKAKYAVSISYLCACLFFASAAFVAGVNWSFWPIWSMALIAMRREIDFLNSITLDKSIYGKHFQKQVMIGGLLLMSLMLGRI